MYIDETSLYTTAQSEPLPVDHEYSCAASVSGVGYGLEVGRSVHTVGGAVAYCVATRTACFISGA